MSKLIKLIKSPGVFFRDALVNKYPVKLSDGENYISAAGSKKQGKNQKNISDALRSLDCDDINVTFPVDIVFTWVDADDPSFIEQFNQYATADAQKSVLSDAARFKSLDELKYALRSIFDYAPWVNKIYIVTNGQKPCWLNDGHPKVRIVPHAEILEQQYLPTFNSHVIESAIHKIEGLSEHYIYFNDDMMLLRKVGPEYFFLNSGLGIMFTSKVRLPRSQINGIYDTATEWGAKNARKLIFSKFGIYTDKMFAHTFYPQIKSVADYCERSWPDEFHRCRQNRFRHSTDLLCTGFLFPHVAQIKGSAIFSKTRLFYFNIRKRTALKYYKMLEDKKGNDSIPFSLCPNDRAADDSRDFEDYSVHLQTALQKYYDTPSPVELLDNRI